MINLEIVFWILKTSFNCKGRDMCHDKLGIGESSLSQILSSCQPSNSKNSKLTV